MRTDQEDAVLTRILDGDGIGLVPVTFNGERTAAIAEFVMDDDGEVTDVHPLAVLLTDGLFGRLTPPEGEVRERLEYLRGQLRAEAISYGELAELQSLAQHIEPGDTELLEAAGADEDIPAGYADAGDFFDDFLGGIAAMIGSNLPQSDEDEDEDEHPADCDGTTEAPYTGFGGQPITGTCQHPSHGITGIKRPNGISLTEGEAY
jgi:hypothetical protein